MAICYFSFASTTAVVHEAVRDDSHFTIVTLDWFLIIVVVLFVQHKHTCFHCHGYNHSLIEIAATLLLLYTAEIVLLIDKTATARTTTSTTENDSVAFDCVFLLLYCRL